MTDKPKYETIGNKINRGISFIVYSEPGVGKTTLATTLPVNETLIINSEAGMGALLGTGHAVFNLKDDLSDLQELYAYLRTQKHPFKYVVVDNLSEMESWMVNVLTTSRKKDFSEIKEYGDCAYKMREYILLFRDLVFKNINVVFNAWEMQLDVTNLEGMIVTKTYPKLFKKLASEACGLVDMVGRLEMVAKTGDRYLRFEPTRDIMAKSGLKGIDKFEPPSFPDIFAKLWTHDYNPVDNGKEVAKNAK